MLQNLQLNDIERKVDNMSGFHRKMRTMIIRNDAKRVAVILYKYYLIVVFIGILFSCHEAVANVGGYAQKGINNLDESYISLLNGNGPHDIIEVAKKQIGYTGSNLGYTGEWCAAFVNDCAYACGQEAAIPFISGKTHSVVGLHQAILDKGGYEVSDPQAGDIIFYYCNICKCYAHVGIYDGSERIEGNVGNAVSRYSPPSRYLHRWENIENGTSGYHYESNGEISVSFIRPNYGLSSISNNSNRLFPNGNYLIVNAKDSRYFLDIAGSDIPASTGTNVVLYGPYDGKPADSDFFNIQFSNGYYTIKQMNAEINLDIEGKSLSQGANVQVNSPNYEKSQQWEIRKLNDGSYAIRSRLSGRALDIDGANIVYGSNIQQWEWNGTVAQKWKFIPYNQFAGASDSEQPVVTNSEITNVSSTGYDVRVSASDNVGVTRIQIGTWNDNMSSEDAVWQAAIAIDGTATFHVNISDFNNVNGLTYHTNAVAFDAAGNASTSERIGDPYIGAAPTTVTLLADKDAITAGDSVTFTYNSDQTQSFWMRRYNDSVNDVVQVSREGTFSWIFEQEGVYSVYITSSNPAGYVDSEPITITVTKHGTVDDIIVASSIDVLAGEKIKLNVSTNPAGLEDKLSYNFVNSNLAEIDSDLYITGKYDTNLGFYDYTYPGQRSTVMTITSDNGVKKEVTVNVLSNIVSWGFTFNGVQPESFDHVDVYEVGETIPYNVTYTLMNDYDPGYEGDPDEERYSDDFSVNYTNRTITFNRATDNLDLGMFMEFIDEDRGYPHTIIVIDPDLAVRVPEAVTEIDEGAFNNTKARYFYLSDNVTTVGKNAFPEGSYLFLNTSKLEEYEFGTEIKLFIETGNEFNTVFASQHENYKCLRGIDVPEQYTAWSEWSTERPSSGEIESKTQYRSAVIAQTQKLTEWSAWSAWSLDSESISDANLKQEQTRIVYPYYCFVCSSCGYHSAYWGSSRCPNGHYISADSFAINVYEITTPKSECTQIDSIKYKTSFNGGDWFYWDDGSSDLQNPKTQYSYRTRTYYTETTMGSYGSWQDEVINASESLSVETRTVYRNRNRIY